MYPLAALRQSQSQPQPQLWFHLHVGVLLESWPVGSGSYNHFRLDLTASVAKLAGDGRLVFKEDRSEVKRTGIKKKNNLS